MTINILENFFSNLSFFILFLTTCYYWITEISKVPSESIELSTTKIILQKETPGFWSHNNIGFFGLVLSTIVITLQLVLRWIDSGHFPLSNLYESLLFLAWGLLMIYIFIEQSFQNRTLGVLVVPIILSIIAFTEFSLPNELQLSKPLVPALQSNWLFMHVSVMMLSYAALLFGSISSMLYLVGFFLFKNSQQLSISDEAVLQSQFKEIGMGKTQNLVRLDEISYRLIGIGFCFLTLGILSGAVWANETWGTYWSWDPKETWALITWLTFAIYLHTRFIKGWEGQKPAWIASIGFFIIWICYLGVNLLGSGLHSYGFFSS
jgi:cytochrome c-type biogenesis protein CcsB